MNDCSREQARERGRSCKSRVHDGDTAGEDWIRDRSPVIAGSHTELVTCVGDRKTPSRGTLREPGHLRQYRRVNHKPVCRLGGGRTLEEPDEESTSNKSGEVGHDTYACEVHDRIALHNDNRRTLKNTHDTAAQDHGGHENAWSNDL